MLSGGAGRDLLIAGALASILNGGDDEDILIAGTTDYDRDAAALTGIMAEWANSGTASRLNANTVHSNGRGNTLAGNAGRDLFFANLALDTLDRDLLTEDLVEL